MTWPQLDGRRILVTGATGFIGGRIVERLALETDASIRVAVRNLSRLPRIARFDLDMVQCDLLDPHQVDSAVRGSDVVFHCAYGNRGNVATQARVSVEGTQNVLEAALSSNVERLVHFSTFAVYGSSPSGVITELTPRRKSGQLYADAKLEAENHVKHYASRGLSTSILQPTVVYGPFGTTWTGDILDHLQTGRVILVEGGSGTFNPVYVDDVVTASFLAATKAEAAGETFLLSGKEPVTWADFIGEFESMLGRTATVKMSTEEALRFWKGASRRPALFRHLLRVARRPDVLSGILNTRGGSLAFQLSRRLLPSRVRRAILRRSSLPRSTSPASEDRLIHPLNPHAIRFLASSRQVATDKASTVLGYRPRFSLDRGMELTRQWAEWAGLLSTAESASNGPGSLR